MDLLETHIEPLELAGYLIKYPAIPISRLWRNHQMRVLHPKYHPLSRIL